MTLFLIVLLAALTFEYINGFHDTANAIATVVSTKVLTPRAAVMWAAFWNLIGALVGTAVAKTISSGLVDASAVTMTTVLAALLRAGEEITHACGGNARCSTCRVRVLEGGEAERWLLRLPQLVRELALQIGPDGAHIERSPMLHGELLAALLDLLNALRATPGVAPAELEQALLRTRAFVSLLRCTGMRSITAVTLRLDQFAEAGYIAIAPDFLSGAGPNGGGTESLGGPDGARAKIQGLPQAQIDADLVAAIAHVRKLDACNGKVVVGGFCWGGAKTFLHAVHNPGIQAGLVFYGTAADAKDMARIKTPVHGFYASNDARINAGLPAAIEGMKAAGKFFEPVTYEGAGHGFMRAGEDPAGSAENKQARADAWVRIRKILAGI